MSNPNKRDEQGSGHDYLAELKQSRDRYGSLKLADRELIVKLKTLEDRCKQLEVEQFIEELEQFADKRQKDARMIREIETRSAHVEDADLKRYLEKVRGRQQEIQSEIVKARDNVRCSDVEAWRAQHERLRLHEQELESDISALKKLCIDLKIVEREQSSYPGHELIETIGESLRADSERSNLALQRIELLEGMVNATSQHLRKLIGDYRKQQEQRGPGSDRDVFKFVIADLKALVEIAQLEKS